MLNFVFIVIVVIIIVRLLQNVDKCITLSQHYIKTVQEPRYRRDHRAMRSKFRYLSKFIAASRGFYCDSNAFELNNNINHVKIIVLNTSIYCL